MKLTTIVRGVLLPATLAAADLPSRETQLTAATLAAPPDLRDGAAVLGYNAQGELVRLREGKNELICLANEPSKTSFSVACYHRDLEPYMARGRELLAQKVTGQKLTKSGGRRSPKENSRCHESLEPSTYSPGPASMSVTGK